MRETDLSFSVVKELIQDLNIHIKALDFLREWNMIVFCIDFILFCKQV